MGEFSQRLSDVLPVLGGDDAGPGLASACVVLRELPTALILVDGDGIVRLANRRAEEVLGAPAGELEGKAVGDVLVPVEQLRSSLDRDGAGLVARHRCRIERHPGEHATIGFTVSESDIGCLARSARTGFAVVFQDLTQFDRLRRERDRLVQIASVNQSLPTLLHELRNPLASITTCLEVLIEEADGMTGDVREQIHAVLTEARRMRLSLEGIGAVGRTFESRRLEAVDFACREAFRVMAARAQNLGIAAECDVQDLPLLPFDTGTVRAVVFNLINNSIQACRPADRVSLLVRLEGDVLRIEVSDTGHGMTAATMSRCRELFFTTKARGSGIGLALCDDAVRAVGGEMSIASHPDQGTRVTVRVPVRRRGGADRCHEGTG